MKGALREAIVAALPDLTPQGVAFWDALLAVAPDSGCADRVAARLGVIPSTLVCRFDRRGLPSAKSLLVGVRLCLAAALFDQDPNSTIATVAYRLNYASPQSFGRHLRQWRGLTPTVFRERYPFNGELQRFVAHLLVPTASRWHGFHPVTGVAHAGHRPVAFLDHRCPSCGAPSLAAA